MDPITAIINLITEIIRMINKQMEGQTPEQKKIMWDWFIEDQKFWRGLIQNLRGNDK